MGKYIYMCIYIYTYIYTYIHTGMITHQSLILRMMNEITMNGLIWDNHRDASIILKYYWDTNWDANMLIWDNHIHMGVS